MPRMTRAEFEERYGSLAVRDDFCNWLVTAS